MRVLAQHAPILAHVRQCQSLARAPTTFFPHIYVGLELLGESCWLLSTVLLFDGYDAWLLVSLSWERSPLASITIKQWACLPIARSSFWTTNDPLHNSRILYVVGATIASAEFSPVGRRWLSYRGTSLNYPGDATMMRRTAVARK